MARHRLHHCPPVLAAAMLALSVFAVGQTGVRGGAAEAAPDGLADRVQMFPAEQAGAPIVLFVDGGADTVDASGGATISRALSESGVNVGLVETEAAGREPGEAARDIAVLLPGLAESFGNGGDPGSLFLLGRGEGGAAVAGLILEGSQPGVAGAVTLNADLEAARASAADRSDYSRLPPTLLLMRDGGPREFAISARRLGKALRAGGAPHVNDIVFPRDPRATPWGRYDLPFHLILDFVGASRLPQQLSDQLQAEYRAKSPAFSNDDVWAGEAAVEEYPIDRAFMRSMGWLFADRSELLRALPLERYFAVDLLDHLDTLPASTAGSGDYLVVTNVRGERMHFTREELQRARPKLVIGMDDERNLFRISAAYRTGRDYSWLDGSDGTRPWLVRMLGGFLHAPGDAGAALFPRIKTTTRFGLVSGSFRWQAEDPLQPLSDLSPQARETLVTSGCMECHAFRGAGGLGYHIGAFSGVPEAGLGLPLTDYPALVMERFLFDQENVAARMGVVPVPLEREHAQALREIIAREVAGARN